MFASGSVLAHLLRGAVGIGALIASGLLVSSPSPVFSLGLFAVALVAFRGCPMCWALGLVQTAMATRSGRTTGRRCIDGRCLKPASDSRIYDAPPLPIAPKTGHLRG